MHTEKRTNIDGFEVAEVCRASDPEAFRQASRRRNRLFSRHVALWLRGTVETKANRITILPPYTPYNMFDYYTPPGPGLRDTQSLPYLFANTNGDDLESVITFSQRFGLIDGAILSGWVIAVTPRNKGTGRKNFGKEWRKETSHCSQGPLQVEPITFNFAGAIDPYQASFQRAQDKFRNILSRIQRAKTDQDGRHILPKRLITRSRMRPHLVWDEQDKTWLTHWRILSFEAGIYLMLHIDLQRGGFIRRCRRADCSKWFRTNRSVITFCSSRCQNTSVVRQYRARKKTIESS